MSSDSSHKNDRAVLIARSIAGAGVLMLAAGSALVYPPAGLIVAGLCCLVIGIGALR